MHGATLLSIPQFRDWNRREYISLKGLAITQRSYSMFENRHGLRQIYRRGGTKRRLEEDVASGADRGSSTCETCRSSLQLGKTRI